MEFKIIEAVSSHIEQVGKLFDLYRQFYKYDSNLITSTNYIKDRINNKESKIFFAINDTNEAIGFVQLYETFGSLDLGKIIILYDLYVAKECRKYGIGERLMKKSQEYAESIGAKSIELSTAKDNSTAQSLYEKIGYIRDNEFYSYSYNL